MKKKYAQVYQFKITLKGIKSPDLAANTSPRNLYLLGYTRRYSRRYGLGRLSSSWIRAGKSFNGFKAEDRNPG